MNLYDLKLQTLFKDYYNSSIKYKNIRIIHSNVKSMLYSKEIKIYNSDSKYKFDYNNGIQILHLRRLGIPFYLESFDFYTLLISLCTNLSFYNGMVIDDSLYVFWKQLWSVSDFEIITQRLLNIHKNPNIEINIERCIELLTNLELQKSITV